MIRWLPRLLIFLSMLLLFGLVTHEVEATVPATGEPGRPDQAVLMPADAEAVAGAGILSSVGDAYLSAATATPHPFTYLLVRWEALVPTGAALRLEIRASSDGRTWSNWGTVEANPELWMPEDGEGVFWSEEIYAGEARRFWQVRALRDAAADGTLPELQRIEVNSIDARFGPADPLPSFDSDQPGLASLARPPVVTRTGWGNPDGQGSRATPVYYPVKHMIVHHTADANSLGGSQQVWADRVRAIWSFHTFTRGWGDIGYNFLIDPNGVIYEGRAGGDNAVGFHDTANYGSMGISVIGTYATVNPPAPAVDSLVELLAWKADQQGIDPLGRAFYYGCSRSAFCNPFNPGAIIENIAGHRQVTPGHTTCPGDRFMEMLPGIRWRIHERLQGIVSNPLLIDERDSGFTRSNANWYEAACGYGGTALHTFATDNPAESTNYGRWRPTISQAGNYQILVHIPQGCSLGHATNRATYRITSADGTQEVTISHNTRDEWVALGSFRFNAGQDGFVELNDLTGEPLSEQRLIFFDSMHFVFENDATARLDLLNVRYDRQEVSAGELLKVTFTVKNSGSLSIESQAPEASRNSASPSGFDLDNSYVYEEGECFQGNELQSYPAFPKEAGRFRVVLGPVEAGRQPTCAGETGGYPWRWGLNGSLAPGETREIVGYIRLRTPGQFTLQAGAIHEYVGYMARSLAPTTITVQPERQMPAPAAYTDALGPKAHVYRLGFVPDNLLARTVDPTAIPRGTYMGSFAWDGTTLDWGDGGPLPEVSELTDHFLVEQTRSIVIAQAGEYIFRLTSDDGAWLWINGRLVVSNPGLQPTRSVIGSVYLEAGRHVLAFKMFERSGQATAGYDLLAPGAADFSTVIDGLLINPQGRLGNTFHRLDGLHLVADDLGGAGIARVEVSINDGAWQTYEGSGVMLDGFGLGTHTIRYTAFDSLGNQSEERVMVVTIDPERQIEQVFLPLIRR